MSDENPKPNPDPFAEARASLWGTPGDAAAGEGGESGEEAPAVALQGSQSLGWDLLFDFHAMVEQLRATDGIVDVQATIHPPVPLFTINTIEHGLGIRVPARIRSFYMVCDGLEFSWSYEQDSRVIPGGGAHLFDFATVFDSWLDSLWLSEETMSAEQVDFMWTLRGFDRTFHAPSLGSSAPAEGLAEREMVVMCVEEEYPTYDLFVHDPQTRTSRLLDVSFREYFDCLLAARGTYGWQKLLLEDPEGEEDKLSDFYRLTDRFFPPSDLSRWRR